MGKIFKFIENIKENLTDHQKDCYGAVKWLITREGRRSGRTYLQAVIAIEAAVNNPGAEIVSRDHYFMRVTNVHGDRYPPGEPDRYLLRMVRDIIDEHADESLRKRFIFTKNGFVYEVEKEQPEIKYRPRVL